MRFQDGLGFFITKLIKYNNKNNTENLIQIYIVSLDGQNDTKRRQSSLIMFILLLMKYRYNSILTIQVIQLLDNTISKTKLFPKKFDCLYE